MVQTFSEEEEQDKIDREHKRKKQEQIDGAKLLTEEEKCFAKKEILAIIGKVVAKKYKELTKTEENWNERKKRIERSKTEGGGARGVKSIKKSLK